MTTARRITAGGAGAILGLFLSSAALASGTVAPTGAAPDPYAQGKAVYARKLACRTCAYPGGLKDAETADQALARVRQGDFGLSSAERDAVAAYISRRFKRG